MPNALRVPVQPYVALCRPHQWVKGIVIILVPLIVGGDILRHAPALLATLAAFSLVSSAIYIMNDLVDAERDRLHPRKRHRPLASGAVSTGGAGALGLALILGSALIGWLISWQVLLCIGLYAALNIGYCTHFKHRSIVDVMSVSTGFILRGAAGALAVSVVPHAFILAALGCAAFTIVMSKRRGELATSSDAARQRPALRGYSLPVLDAGGLVAATCAVVTYIAYLASVATTNAQTGAVAALAIVTLAAVLRFLQVTLLEGTQAEDPSRLLRSDLTLRSLGVAWLSLTVLQVVLHDAGV